MLRNLEHMEHEKGEKYVSLQTPQTPRVEWYLDFCLLQWSKRAKVSSPFLHGCGAYTRRSPLWPRWALVWTRILTPRRDAATED